MKKLFILFVLLSSSVAFPQTAKQMLRQQQQILQEALDAKTAVATQLVAVQDSLANAKKAVEISKANEVKLLLFAKECQERATASDKRAADSDKKAEAALDKYDFLSKKVNSLAYWVAGIITLVIVSAAVSKLWVLLTTFGWYGWAGAGASAVAIYLAVFAAVQTYFRMR